MGRGMLSSFSHIQLAFYRKIFSLELKLAIEAIAAILVTNKLLKSIDCRVTEANCLGLKA